MVVCIGGVLLLAAMYRCVLQGIEETWLFSVCAMSRNAGYQNEAFGDRLSRYRLAVKYACRCAKSN